MICMSLGLMIHLIETTLWIKILMDDIIITENIKLHSFFVLFLLSLMLETHLEIWIVDNKHILFEYLN